MKIPLLLAIIDIMGDDWYKVPRAKREMIEEKMESAFRISYVDTDSDKLCNSIGMQHKKCSEIQDHCKAVFKEYEIEDLKNIPLMLEKFSSVCSTREELAMATFNYAFNLAINQNPMSGLMAMIAKVIKNDD